MKRHGNLFEKIVDMDNIRLAYKNAKKGKSRYKEVRMIEQNSEFYLNQIQEMLQNKTFTTSEYQIADIRDKKKIRTIHKLPFFPDRIVHHALMQVVEPILFRSLIRDTFQSIKGRGVNDARKRVTKIINQQNPKYCLKVDIKKYYPSINNDILKQKIQRKIKCKDTIWLINDIIDSTKGLPIGNYTSQIFGNFYLSNLDWYFKHKKLIYFRYCDDIVILNDNKTILRKNLNSLIQKLKELNLSLKPNFQIFPIEKRNLDFVGYVFSKNKITLRKSISKSFLTIINKQKTESLSGFWGWIKHIRMFNLWNDINIKFAEQL